MISKKWIFNKMVTNNDAAKTRHRRVCDHTDFDWGKVGQDFAKFGAIRCHKEADRVFLLKVLALSQTTIPTWAVWDALEAVKQIGPHTPLAYFRVVLRDNCRKSKSGVDLDKALRTVKKVPADLPRQRPTKRRTTPLPDDALRFAMSELQEAIP